MTVDTSSAPVTKAIEQLTRTLDLYFNDVALSARDVAEAFLGLVEATLRTEAAKVLVPPEAREAETLSKLTQERDAEKSAREHAEREVEEQRRCRLANEVELRRADAELGHMQTSLSEERKNRIAAWARADALATAVASGDLLGWAAPEHIDAVGEWAKRAASAMNTGLPHGAHVLANPQSLTGAVEATHFMRASMGRSLRAAREHAGLTVEQLAEKLTGGGTQFIASQVAATETGRLAVSEGYVRLVLAACGLPEDWKAPGPGTPDGSLEHAAETMFDAWRESAFQSQKFVRRWGDLHAHERDAWRVVAAQPLQDHDDLHAARAEIERLKAQVQRLNGEWGHELREAAAELASVRAELATLKAASPAHIPVPDSLPSDRVLDCLALRFAHDAMSGGHDAEAGERLRQIALDRVETRLDRYRRDDEALAVARAQQKRKNLAATNFTTPGAS